MADGIDVKAEGRKAIDRQQDAMRQAAGKDYVNAGAKHFREPLPTVYPRRYADWVGNFQRSPQYIPARRRLTRRSNGKQR